MAKEEQATQLTKEQLEAKAREHSRSYYRQKFNETKTAKRLFFASIGLALAGAVLTLAPPLVLSGLTLAVENAIIPMLSGIGVLLTAFIPITIDSVKSRQFAKRETAKDIANGSLVDRYKNEYGVNTVEKLEKESQSLSTQAADLQTRAGELLTRAAKLRNAFGLAKAPIASPETGKPATPAVLGSAAP